MTIFPRHRIDISARDLFFALWASVRPRHRKKPLEETRRSLANPDELVFCLSVRSGFELLLETLALPAASEVIVSAVTHPDLAGLLERHGLRVIPVDLDLETLAPRVDLLARAISPQTRAILVAHLFGTSNDLGPIAEVARGHGLLLLEDCAQSYRGPGETGDARADVSMFSFGPIKTATALGGAILRVRDEGLRRRMRITLESWPLQPRREFLARVLRFLGLMLLARPRAYGLLVSCCGLLGRDVERSVRSATRGYAHPCGHPAFLQKIRRRPSAPLLALLSRRVREFDQDRLERRARRGELVARSLPATLVHPGGDAPVRTHWVFPVLAGDPADLISALRCRGFDATQATTAIAALRAPVSRPELEPCAAAEMMSKIVFLPVYPEMPEGAVRRLIEAISEAALDPSPKPLAPAKPAEVSPA